jgi:serine/threonine-protein kinase HipA
MTATTHILKPQIGSAGPGFQFTESVENEWLCSKIIAAFDVPVAECSIESFEDFKVLVIQRFDREWLKDRLIRIPQEDMCQALQIPSFKKYENEGGPGIPQIMRLFNESQNPILDRKIFMKTQILFLILAAIDGHAKNFSIRWGPDGFKMTPSYDVISAHPLVQKKVIHSERLKMAMAVGQKRHYHLKKISKKHIFETAKICRFEQKETQQILDEILQKAPLVFKQITSMLSTQNDFPEDVAIAIINGAMKRLALFE